MKAKLIKDNIEALIAIRSLGLFLFNFESEDIAELCEKSREFNHMWETLEAEVRSRTKSKGWITIDHKDFYDAFYSKIRFGTQALIVEKAMQLHGEEVRKNILFNIKIEEKRDEVLTERTQQ